MKINRVPVAVDDDAWLAPGVDSLGSSAVVLCNAVQYSKEILSEKCMERFHFQDSGFFSLWSYPQNKTMDRSRSRFSSDRQTAGYERLSIVDSNRNENHSL